jgi:hypothetical protein
MRTLPNATLLQLLELYERTIVELERLRDPGVAGLLRRIERHRAEVVAALAAQASPRPSGA